MVRRTMDVARLNELANHQALRPFLGGVDGPLDLTPLVDNPEVIVLEGDGGAFLLTPLYPGCYELHTLFLPEARGALFFIQAQEMFRYIFTQTDALEIVTKCPDDNRGAALAATKAGFRERFHRADAWKPGVGVSFRGLSIDDWFIRDPECEREGVEFHAMLEGAKEAAKSSLKPHPVDPVHDHAVGAALLMAKAGRLEKGVGFYVRWATFAGYAPIYVAGTGLIDIHDALIEIRDGSMNVLLCRGKEST